MNNGKACNPDKETFSTGAQRDTQTNKLRYDLIPVGPLAALAKVYTDGAVKYGDDNWEKGMPFKRVYASLLRHIFAWVAGDTSERHMANAAWNCFTLLQYEDRVKQGVLPASLDDRKKPVEVSSKPTTDDLLKTFRPDLDITDEQYSQAMGEYATAEVDAFEEETERLNKWLVDQDITAIITGVAATIPSFMDASSDEPYEYDTHEGGPVTLEDERRGHHFNELITMGCSPDVAAQVVGGMTFTREKERGWVYVAGPMRGYADFNFPAFDKARDYMLGLGFNVISPADIDRTSGDSNGDDQSRFALRDFWSLYFIAKSPLHGIIALLPNWHESIGANAEAAIAKWLKLERHYV